MRWKAIDRTDTGCRKTPRLALTTICLLAFFVAQGVQNAANADEVAAGKPTKEENTAASKNSRSDKADKELLEFMSEFSDLDDSSFDLMIYHGVEDAKEEKSEDDEGEGHED